jgi:holo-[acyl-carrier protein] synthase
MIAIGTDIVEIGRVEAVFARQGQRFLARILTEREQAVARSLVHPARYLAKRFAAKEAISKALGTGIGRRLSWQDLDIDAQRSGAPLVVLSSRGRALLESVGGSRVLITISDERAYAVAFAVVLA